MPSVLMLVLCLCVAFLVFVLKIPNLSTLHLNMLSIVTEEAYIDVPVSNKVLMHICDKLGLEKKAENELTVRMIKI